jgi:hypothetical protein
MNNSSTFKSHPSRRVRKFLNSGLFLAALILCISCNTKHKGLTIVEASLVQEVRDFNDTIFFGSIADIEFSNNRFFLTDGSANQVIVIDDELQYVDRFGKSGAGPGEIRGIMNVETSDDLIYVQDMLGAKVLEYDNNFQLLNTFKVHLSSSEVVVDNNMIIGQLYGEIEDPFCFINTRTSHQKRFGKMLEPDLGYPWKHTLKYKDYLLIFHQLNSAKVEVYNDKGEFLNSADLSVLNKDLAAWIESTNIPAKVQSSRKHIKNAQVVVNDIVQHNDKFYLNTPPISIDGKTEDGIILEVSMNDQLEFNIDRIILLNDYIGFRSFTMPSSNTILGYEPVNGSLKLFQF